MLSLRHSISANGVPRASELNGQTRTLGFASKPRHMARDPAASL